MRCAYRAAGCSTKREPVPSRRLSPNKNPLVRRFTIRPTQCRNTAGWCLRISGPQPAPMLPRWDVLARGDGTRVLEVHPDLDCNWLQCQENSLDPAHTYYLHVRRMVEKGLWAPKSLRAPERYALQQFPLGIVKKRVFGNDSDVPWAQRGHPAIFPNILLHVIERPGLAGVADPESIAALPIDIQIRVPGMTRTPRSTSCTSLRMKTVMMTPRPSPRRSSTLRRRTSLASFTSRASRARMRLRGRRRGQSRIGRLSAWRRLMHEQIEVVQDGGEPIAVFREVDDIIDLGPSREWNGERWVAKARKGWGETRVWESPVVTIGR
jgi:5,5'-dehydrodivanillate O-demethylase